MLSGGNVFEQAIANVGRIPREGWLVGLFACGLSASSDLAFWTTGQVLSWTWVAPFIFLAAVWLCAVYFCTAGIAGRSVTFLGYTRFALTTVATVVPLGLTLAIFIFGKPFLTEAARVSVLLVGCVIGFVFASLLVGWPMAQSMSASFVSPIRVLKATQRHRWSLILLGFAATGIGNADLGPDISKAGNVAEAAPIAIAGGFIGLLILGLTAAIAAAAWQFASHADPTLDPS